MFLQLSPRGDVSIVVATIIGQFAIMKMDDVSANTVKKILRMRYNDQDSVEFFQIFF
jgi:hypothetical protein